MNKPQINIIYVYFIFSFLSSFIIFKIFDNDYSLMRFSFFIFIFSSSFFFILKRNFKKIGFIHLVLVFLVLIRSIYSEVDLFRFSFVLCFFLLPILIQMLYAPLSYRSSIKKLFKYLYLLQLYLSFFYLLFFDFNERFEGYTNSSTTYSTYLLTFLTGYLFTKNNINKYTYIHFIPTFFLIFLSQTRTSLLILIIIFIIYYFRNFVFKHLRLTSFISITGLLLLLPLSSLFSDGFKIMNRYEENEDDQSTMSRLYYFNNQINSLSKFSYEDYFFGKGVDSNKTVYTSTRDYNQIDQHNDFYLILYDYGIIITFLFMYCLIIKINSTFSFVFAIIYFTSFYHNMIYDFWLISFLFISSLYSHESKVLNYASN